MAPRTPRPSLPFELLRNRPMKLSHSEQHLLQMHTQIPHQTQHDLNLGALKKPSSSSPRELVLCIRICILHCGFCSRSRRDAVSTVST
mmetsp:Transcript_12512/g.36253  ORF Transcript_12512/g.36253 Transcript_12512/m.36253 type:complete len:88 (-) Transcript_12512:264-527(-)